jgi:transposase
MLALSETITSARGPKKGLPPMAKYLIGIDLHKTVLQACVLDSSGELVRERRFAVQDREQGIAAVRWLLSFMASGRLAVEALGCNRWFVNACLERNWDVLVVDASKLGLRKSGKKTDRRDAYEIARRLYLGDLDRSARTYYPNDEEYGRRQLTRVAHSQVQKRTHTLAQIRAMLNAYKITPTVRALWSKEGLAWLRQVTLPTEDLALTFQVLVDDLESVHQRVVALKSRIAHVAAQDPKTRGMMDHLPHVGPQTALMLKCELGDARRFRNARAVSSYGGLVPRVTASADRAHHGAMTKRGNAHLRWILGQWAVRLLVHNPIVQEWARPYYRRMHKNKVRGALARRLFLGAWALLSRGEVFSLHRCLGLKQTG